MKNKLAKILPWVTVFGLLLALSSFLLINNQLSSMYESDPEVIIEVNKTISDFIEISIESANEPKLQNALESLLSKPHIATVWFFDPEGTIVFASGSTARSASSGNASQLATNEVNEMMSALPEDTFSQEQITMISAASTIQREGEHNDIYDHLLRAITSPDGETIGYLGMAYENNSHSNNPGLSYKLSIFMFIAGLLFYWLSLPIWVFLDARQRKENAWVWMIYILMGNFIAFLAYLLVRYKIPRRPIE